jgi:acyl carrier protein
VEGKAEIREFVRKLLARKGDTEPFAGDGSLLLSGRLQSVEAIELAVFLEEKFGVDFAKLGFDQEMIDTLDAISTLVQDSVKKP